MNKTIQLNKRFRPEIEGLRVVAALLVAVYHIWLGRVSGGVDVFFVVSGFLITTSIVSKYNRTGEFKFIPYVTNLIKRLFPAVITVVFAVIILSAFFLPRTILDKTVSEVIASIFYYQNWQLALSNTDYLNQEQMKTPLEHFWAMSIQGQFYLIWFLVFTLIFYLAKKPLKINGLQLVNITLGILFILSLSYSIFLTSVNQPWAYFDVSTRIWEFSLGGLLAVNLSRIPLNAFVGNIIGWIGLIGLLLTGVIFDVSTLFPGYIALWPMLCAVAILMSGNIDTKFGVKRLLGSKPMVKIGGLSFGLYLWHWVILSFYQYHFDNRPSIVVGVGIIIFSLVLSWLMTKYIEEPLRYMKSTVKPILSIGIGIALNIILLYSLVFILNINTTDV